MSRSIVRSSTYTSLFVLAAVAHLSACEPTEPASDEGGGGNASGAGGENADPEAFDGADPQDAVAFDIVSAEAVGDDLHIVRMSPETYAALHALTPGDSLFDSDEPGVVAFRDAFLADFGSSSAATAMCSNVVIPVSAGECAELWPELLDGGSYDPDQSALGLAGLESTLSAWSLCGLGEHEVSLIVSDQEGTSSTCSSSVRLCDPATDIDCPQAVTVLADPPGLVDTCTDAAVRCVWSESFTVTPDEQTRSPLAKGRKVNGRGPTHAALVEEWVPRNCLSDDVDEDAESLQGDVTLNVGLLCYNAAGAVCGTTCTQDIEVQAIYRSEVRAATAIPLGCPPPWGSETEAFTQDEVEFVITNTPGGFSKGVAIQSGNELTKTISFELGAGAGASSQEGASANVSASVGYSVTESGRVGTPAPDYIHAFGGGTVERPLTARLHSLAKSEIRIRDRARARSLVLPDDWLVYYAAKTSCADVGWTGGGRSSGERQGHLLSDQAAANAFFTTRGVNVAFAIPK